MALSDMITLEHRVCKMRITIPRDQMQTHMSAGKPVLYTVTFFPSEWEPVFVDE